MDRSSSRVRGAGVSRGGAAGYPPVRQPQCARRMIRVIDDAVIDSPYTEAVPKSYPSFLKTWGFLFHSSPTQPFSAILFFAGTSFFIPRVPIPFEIPFISSPRTS
ncbi:hypothetical protein E2C01_058855 [Portunus trituberculatus]|uniref:Uncharacterized protein n=1 Tax=Portunus trituberculatus TaxID=210409 RepID=A0A5B7H7H9_PORTR|nr:hypothetical protein [Portunus trituberculatus]